MIRSGNQLLLAASLSFAITATATHAFAQQRRAPMPPIRHVFVIVLENQGFDTTFNGHSRAPYLADTLRRAGAFLRQYHGIAHYSLGNYLAMIAGVPPTPKTQVDCPHSTISSRPESRAMGSRSAMDACIPHTSPPSPTSSRRSA